MNKVQPIKKVRCINNADDSALILGQMYDVFVESSKKYLIIYNDGTMENVIIGHIENFLDIKQERNQKLMKINKNE